MPALTTLKQRLQQRYWQLMSAYLDKRQPASSKVKLVQKLIFILPTRYGWWFLLLIVLLYLLGTNYQNNLILLTCYLLLSVFLLCIVLCYQNLSGLTLHCPVAAEGFAGQPIYISIGLSSDSSSANDHVMLSLHFVGQPQQPSLATLCSTVNLAISNTQRGKYRLPRLKISSQYPFGLWRGWSYIALAQDYWLYPSPDGQVKRDLSASTDTKEQQAVQQHGDVLAPYRHGDSVRHLVWKRLARDPANPVVRQQLSTPEAEPSWVIIPPASGEALERVLRQGCRQLLDLEQAGQQYGVKLPHLTIAQSSGPQQLQRCLQALALC